MKMVIPSLCLVCSFLVSSVLADADLSVTKSDAQDPITPGSNLIYSVVLTNGGPASAANVVLTDSLPPNVTVVSIEGPEHWACANSPQQDTAGAVSCSCASMESGETVAFSLNLKPKSAGVFTNTVSVTASGTDPNLENNSDSEDTTVIAAAEPNTNSH